MKTLLLGCGTKKNKRLWLDEGEKWTGELVTLDFEKSHNPDIIWDLNNRPLPFKDDEFDQIHAYEVLEHIGRQGDWETFFLEWAEYWRILKQGGHFLATCPHWNSMGAWGDPSHTRVLTPMTLAFLSQKIYKEDVGRTVMSDFRSHWKGDFVTEWIDLNKETFSFVMRAVK